MKLVKFEKDACPACVLVEGYLHETGTSYETRNISHDEKAKSLLEKNGVMGVPVVALMNEKEEFIDSVIGFNPPRIAQLLVQIEENV